MTTPMTMPPWLEDMDPVIAQQWADDLESGNYPQGNGRLRKMREDGSYEYCCLGVLHDQMVRAGLASWAFLDEDGNAVDIGSYELLPDATAEWAGCIHNPDVGPTDEGAWITASEANDEYNWSFPQIARGIRGQEDTWDAD